MKMAITTANKMQGRPMGLLTEQDDINWCWEVHLNDNKPDSLRAAIRAHGYELFRSFVMCGWHESSPEFIYLFKKADPHYRGKCLEIDLREENTGCHEEKPFDEQRITNAAAQPEAAAENPGLAPGAGDPA